MYTTQEIANFFIAKSLKTDVSLNPTKLIKLMDIANGWHLGIFSKELIDKPVSAYKDGTIIEAVHHEFNRFGNNQITELCKTGYRLLSEEIDSFLHMVWGIYAPFDSVTLSVLTREKNTPWDIVWNQSNTESRDENALIPIPSGLIEEYYKRRIDAMKNVKLKD